MNQGSKKLKIILIAVIFLGLLILVFYFFSKNKTNTSTNPVYNLYQKFNPFGSKNTNNPEGEGNEKITENKPEETEQPKRLNKLTDFAISGAVFFEEQKSIVSTDLTETEPQAEKIPSLRYVERATGHIYQMNLLNKSIGKISNSTIPSVYEAIFDGTASSVIYRYVSSGERAITSFLATLGGKSEFLNTDILEIAVSPLKDKFFSIIKNKNGVTGNIKYFNESKTTQVFSSPFSEWLPQWVKEQTIFLTTKPSYLVNGSIFSLNTTNGTLTKVLGDIPGLTTLSNKEASLLLYGASLDTGPKLNVFDIKNHTTKDLGVYGLPEKCVWSVDNINVYCAAPATIVGTQYPDSWYQGLTSFNDYFVKINTETKNVSTLTNIGDTEQIDAINLFLNRDESKIFFTNKKDYTLWSIDL